MEELSQAKPFSEAMEIYHLPRARIIGRETRNGGRLGNTAPALWDQVYAAADHKLMEAMPHLNGPDLMGWTCDYDEASPTFCYLVCALTPADTPVPPGFDWRNVPETLCAIGLYGESVEKTLRRARELGYENNWAQKDCGWNAELYFHAEEENPSKRTAQPWHFLVPVKRIG